MCPLLGGAFWGEVIVGVPDGGLSAPATDEGTVYHWNDDFNVSGGHFSVIV